jgi:hypothetical protein
MATPTANGVFLNDGFCMLKPPACGEIWNQPLMRRDFLVTGETDSAVRDDL